MIAEHVPDQFQGLLLEHDVAEDSPFVEQHEQPLTHATGRRREAVSTHGAVGVGKGSPALTACAVQVGHAPLVLGGGLRAQPLARLLQLGGGQGVRQQAVAAALQVRLAARRVGGEPRPLGPATRRGLTGREESVAGFHG